MTRRVLQRPWLARFVLLAFSLVIAVLAMEAFIRMTSVDRPLVWQPDPTLGWWHVPGARQHWTDEGDGRIEINSVGLRDRERQVARDPGVLRIAVFGDSMTEGVQVNLDQTFCQLLEERLSRRLGRPIEVLNFGVNGYSPLQEYLLYKSHGHAFEPDVVLHAVFLDNDVADGDRRLASGQRGAPFVAGDGPGGLTIDYSAALESHGAYAREPIATLRRVSSLYRVASAARWTRVDAASFAAGLAAGQGVPRRYMLYAEPAPPEWDAAWHTLEGIVAEFASEARKDGIEYALISVPAGQVVNTEAWDQLEERFPAMRSMHWDLRGPERRLEALAGRHQIPYISTVDAYSASPERRRLFFGLVGHLTPRGHRVMADIVEEALVARHLLPRHRKGDE